MTRLYLIDIRDSTIIILHSKFFLTILRDYLKSLRNFPSCPENVTILYTTLKHLGIFGSGFC